MTQEMKLLKAAKNGNTAAFEHIVKKYQSLVCAITFSGTGRVDISEELAQETFLSAWKNLRQLTDPSGFRPWLCTIARNMLNSYYRKKKTIPLDPADMSGLSDNTHNPSDYLIIQEEHAMLEQALMQIPAEYREPLVMYYRQEKSTKEVAIGLGLKESTARMRLHRARQMLREDIAARLEWTLERTAPDKAFTRAVMAGIGAGLAAGATGTVSAAAAVTAAGAGTGATTGIAAVMSTATAKVVTAAAVAAITVGGVFTYKHLSQPKSPPTQPDEVATVQDTQEPAQMPGDNNDSPPQQDTTADQIKTPQVQTASVPSRSQAEDIPKNITAAVPNNADLVSTANLDDKTGREVNIIVTDKRTQNPIAKADVYTTASLWSNEKQSHATTDATGRCQQRWQKNKAQILTVWVKKEGYVPMSYSVRSENSPGNEPITLRYTMEKSTTIGGIVQNDSGQPMPNIKLSIHVNNTEHMKKPEIHVWQGVQTDEHGRWTFDGVPQEMQAVSLTTTIQDYAEKRAWVKTPEDIQLLRDREYVLVVDAGYSITGTVIDESGNPVKGAQVQLGDWFLSKDRQHRTYTDEKGLFDFSNLKISGTEFTYDTIEGKGKVPVQYPAEYLTVTADGFAPQMQQLFFKEKHQQVDIIMVPGQPVYGRVVDYQGNPISEATVRADDWGSRYPDHVRPLDWNTKTDDKGRFVWQNAPDDKVELIVSKEGYMTLAQTMVSPSETEYEFILNPMIRVTGQVINAATKKPITKFTFRRHEGGYISTRKTIENKNGQFETAFKDQSQTFTISFEASGYKPTRSREITLIEQDIELLIEMQPDAGLYGIVVDADKNPIEGVIVIVPNGVFHLDDDIAYRMDWLRYHPNTKTDAEGKFHLDPIGKDEYTLLVAEEQGYLYIHSTDFPKDGVFVLQPYGRIEGTYYKGSRPVVNHTIGLDYPSYHFENMKNLAVRHNVKTDENGQFVFDKLIHGTARILIDPYKYVEVKSGQTHEIHIGGDGLTVQGYILTPDGHPLNEDFGQCSLGCRRIYDSLPIPEDELPLPDGVDVMSYTGLMEWFTEFGSSGEGQMWAKAIEQKYGDLTESHGFGVDPNGRFEAPNITPGTYLFTATVKPWQNPDQFPRRADYNTIIAQASTVFIVPEFDTVEDMDIPVDLGTIQCRPAPLSAGQKAPGFDISKLKSTGRIKLSDYRGKTVLLNFTNPAQKDTEPDKAAMLEQVCEHAKGKTEIINVAMEMIPWGYMRQKMIPECTLPGLYGVATAHNSKIDADYKTFHTVPLPYSVLIDQDGTILWIGEPNEELHEKIDTLEH